MRSFAVVAAVVVAFLAVGCPSEQERKLDATYAFVNEKVQALSSKQPAAKAAYDKAVDGGGDVVDYVVASMPKDGDKTMLPIVHDPTAWTVVVRDDGAKHAFVVEGYAADKTKALKSSTLPAP
jgi:hypothetical protein